MIRRQNPAEALQLFTVALERNTSRAGGRPLWPRGRDEALATSPRPIATIAASELDPDCADPRTELTRFTVVGRE